MLETRTNQIYSGSIKATRPDNALIYLAQQALRSHVLATQNGIDLQANEFAPHFAAAAQALQELTFLIQVQSELEPTHKLEPTDDSHK